MSTPMRPSSSTGKATVATVEKVMRSVNKMLSKSEKLDRYASSAAKSAQAVVERHVPIMLDYLPEKKVGKEFVFVLAVTIFIVILFVVGAGDLLLDLIGVMYPWYASVIAIESPEKEKPEATQWLSYWLIFCFMKITEKVMSPLLRLIPMFTFVKVAFLMWLYHPVFMGAKVMYDFFRGPLLALAELAESYLGKSYAAGAGTAHPDMPPPPPESFNKGSSSSSSGSSGSGSSGSGSTGSSKGGEYVKQLTVMVRELSKGSSSSSSGDNSDDASYFVELSAKDSAGDVSTPFKTNPRRWKTASGKGSSIAYNHPIMFVDLGESVEGSTLVIHVKEKTTFNGVQDVASSSLDLSGVDNKRTGSSIMSHTVEMSSGDFTLTLDTEIKTVLND
jgi:uncharacterized membrane protein YgcG